MNDSENLENLEDVVEIANPQHPHCAVVLLLDISSSMAGNKINQLNEGLDVFKKDIYDDDLARKRVEIAVVTFGASVNVKNNFLSIEDFQPQILKAGGFTPMGAGILEAINLIEQRKIEYKSQGIDYYRPWIFMITDGAPTDMRPEGTLYRTVKNEGDTGSLDPLKRIESNEVLWNRVLGAVHEGEAKKKFLFFAVGVEPADMSLLKQIAPPNRPPVKLKQNMFKEMFTWLSNSLGSSGVSGSNIGEQTSLEDPTTENGWAKI